MARNKREADEGAKARPEPRESTDAKPRPVLDQPDAGSRIPYGGVLQRLRRGGGRRYRRDEH